MVNFSNIQEGNLVSGNQYEVLFKVEGVATGLSNGNTITFGMTTENFENDSFQLSNGQTLTVGDINESTFTTFTLASGGTIFAADMTAGEFNGYTSGSYSDGHFTYTASGGGGGGGGGKTTIKGTGKTTIKSTGKLTVK